MKQKNLQVSLSVKRYCFGKTRVQRSHFFLNCDWSMDLWINMKSTVNVYNLFPHFVILGQTHKFVSHAWIYCCAYSYSCSTITVIICSLLKMFWKVVIISWKPYSLCGFCTSENILHILWKEFISVHEKFDSLSLLASPLTSSIITLTFMSFNTHHLWIICFVSTLFIRTRPPHIFLLWYFI